MSWQNIAAAEIAAGAPISQELILKLDQRDKAALECPVGGYWAQVSNNILSDSRFIRLIRIPRAASNLYIECETGPLGTVGSQPEARLYLKNPTTLATSYGAFLDLGGGAMYPQRKQLPPIPIPGLFRGALVELWFDANDSVATATFYCRNLATSATCGYGLRFA